MPRKQVKLDVSCFPSYTHSKTHIIRLEAGRGAVHPSNNMAGRGLLPLANDRIATCPSRRSSKVTNVILPKLTTFPYYKA